MSRAEYLKKWADANKERIREYGRRYYLKNKEMIREKTDVWKAANRNATCEMTKRSQAKHPEKVAARRIRYRAENRERLLAEAKAYREKNREALNEQNRLHQLRKRGRTPEQAEAWKAERARVQATGLKWSQRNKEWVRTYSRIRLKTNPHFAMKVRLCARMYAWFRKSGSRKSIRTRELIGIDYEGFVAHIEALFQPGMSWENRSEWHLDHILPCASFDLTDVDQQKVCFNYKNIQPLWAMDNMKKGDKVPTQSEFQLT